MSSVLSLKGRTPVADGFLRLIFEHPDDSGLLIKVFRPAVVENWDRDTPAWKRRLRRFKYFIYFVREVQEHIVARLEGSSRPDILQTVVGFVDTDLGLGMITRAERGRNGELAPTLYQLVTKGGYDAEAQRAFETFADALLASSAIVGDLQARNLVYSYDPTKGERFVIIDGLGEKNLIPINSMSPYFNRRSKLRRIERLREFIRKGRYD